MATDQPATRPGYIRSKRLLITWSQIGDVPLDIYEAHVLERCGAAGIREYLIVRAPHEEGGWHIHAAVFLRTRPKYRMDHFDFEQLHPNVKTGGTIAAWDNFVRYVSTQPSYNGLSPDTPLGNATSSDDYLALATSGDSAGAMRLFSEKHPRDTALNFLKLRRNFDAMSPIEPTKPLYLFEAFQPDACLLLALERDRLRTLILIGPSGFGKTQFILAWAHHASLNYLFISHTDQLRSFNPKKHQLIIFDDITFTHWPRTQQIAIADYECQRGIHCRYAVATIPAQTPKIFLSNLLPLDTTDEAIGRRCVTVKILGPLFVL